MASYTPNYQLHQWEPQDPFLRTDFNADLSKIDTTLFQLFSQKYGEDKKVFTCGSYVGNGSKQQQEVTLSFQPSLLYLFNRNPEDNQNIYGFALGTGEVQCAFERSGLLWVRDEIFYMIPSGFQINGDAFAQDYGFNTLGVTYQYVAFR